MPEYFEISLIADKSKHQQECIKRCLTDRLGLSEGHNNIKISEYLLLKDKNVLLGIYEHEDTDFEEYCIGFPDYIFRRDAFKEQLKQFTDVIEICFNSCDGILFAVCSYEINANLIEKAEKIQDFDKEFLMQFPIVYSRNSHTKKPVIAINLEAQDLFTENIFA